MDPLLDLPLPYKPPWSFLHTWILPFTMDFPMDHNPKVIFIHPGYPICPWSSSPCHLDPASPTCVSSPHILTWIHPTYCIWPISDPPLDPPSYYIASSSDIPIWILPRSSWHTWITHIHFDPLLDPPYLKHLPHPRSSPIPWICPLIKILDPLHRPIFE